MPPKPRTGIECETDRIIRAIREEMSEMKSELINLKELLTVRDEKITFLENSVIDLRNENKNLRSELVSVIDKLDSTEAYERRDTVIVSGAVSPATQGEITKNVVIELIRDKIGLNIQHNDISIAHRLQTHPKRQGGKPPGICVKLCRRDLKRDLLTASKNQPRRDSSKIFINESLTPTRSAIFKTLRNIKRNNIDLIKGVTTQDGQVVVYTPPQPAATGVTSMRKDIRHRINTRAQLQNFCDEFVRQPLENFIDAWPSA